MFKKTLIFVLISLGCFAQTNYRFKADISIKDKLPNGKYKLSVGQVFYDKIYGKIVFKFRFPKSETHIVQDTSVFLLNDKGQLVNRTQNYMIPELTIFHLALENKIGDFGMNDGRDFYKVIKVEKEGKTVFTTWMPSDPKLHKYLGKIVMANIDKKLDAIAIYGPKGELLSKQFFKEYKTMKGINFPTNVVQYSYSVKDKNLENLRQTTYKNIVIDEASNNEIYRHKVPTKKVK